MNRTVHNSILLKISTLIIVLCLIIMAYSSYGLYLGWVDYKEAKELQIFHDMAESFSDGLKNFMFERGRMNVVLSKEQPISEDNKAFLIERQTASDEAFETGFSTMEKAFPLETENLRKEYENIKALRLTIHKEAEKPLSKRDVNARKLWFNTCTDFIKTVITKINVVRQISQNNGLVSNYFDVVVDSLYFRSIVGNQSSVITSAIAGNGRLSNEDDETLLYLKGEETLIWSELEETVQMLNSEDLIAALENVRDKYYLQFRPEQKRIIELSHKDQIYEGADKEISNLSIPALNSISNLNDEAVKGIEAENKKNIEKGFKSFIVSFGQLLISILIVIFVPIYLRRKFVQPLNDIILILENISQGKVDNQIPHTQRADEIGKLAQGADMLKNSIIEEQTLKLELEKTVIKLEDLSVKDSLTALYNRRYMIERFDEMVNWYKRNTKAFSVIICDVDNFKSVNDSYGHECGDNVLIHVTGKMSEYCRESDILARWGGEEFLFLLPDTGLEGARVLAERIRTGFENTICECNSVSLNVTLTFGVAEYCEGESRQETVKKADIALLKGKINGRNQVVVFRDINETTKLLNTEKKEA